MGSQRGDQRPAGGLKRRGLTLDGQDDHVELPAGKEITICVWARGGKSLPSGATLLEAVDKDGKRVALISLPSAAGQVSFECGNGTDGCDLVAKAAQPAEVKTEGAHWAFTRKGTGELATYRNGAIWASATGSRAIGSAVSAGTIVIV